MSAGFGGKQVSEWRHYGNYRSKWRNMIHPEAGSHSLALSSLEACTTFILLPPASAQSTWAVAFAHPD